MSLTMTTVAGTDERDDVRTRLAAALWALGELGCSEGVAGHITIRDPLCPTEFWVNPFGVHFSGVEPDDLLRVTATGEIVAGDGILNAAAFAIHASLHRARPNVGAAAHTHAPHGRLLSMVARGPEALAAITAPGTEVGWYDDYTGVVLEVDEGVRIATALGTAPALVLRNHGTLTVGRTIEEAVWRYRALERAAATATMALTIHRATGRPLVAGLGAVSFGDDAHARGARWLARVGHRS
jgi:ribulose-5-phosphate 4-epimerase/fuculose-1-phosphate aldolase